MKLETLRTSTPGCEAAKYDRSGRPKYIIFLYLFINGFIRRHEVITSKASFLPIDGRNHLRY